jgi:hypothetical protein
MSAMPAPPVAAYPWPADVLAFAARQHVSQYLEPLLEATRKLFPSAEIRVLFERDPELPDVEWIAFDIRVSKADVSDYLEADRRLGDELFRICPALLVHNFVLSLRRVA